MKYLLDTHIILWALINDSRLDESIKKIIYNNNNSIYYSTASVWEVEINYYSDLSAITGSCFAAFFEGINPAIIVNIIDIIIKAIAPCLGNTALTS